MSRSPAILRRVWMLAPLLSLAIMLGMSRALPNRVVVDERSEQRKALVAETLEAVPYFIGDWIGRDSRDELPPAAQRLLRPNAIFSRRYQRSPGERVDVLVVHCSDARDMIGHYPPICYPSAGWTAGPAEPVDRTLDVATHRLPVRTYLFQRVQDRAGDITIRIFSAFVLPDGNVTPDISDINRQSERLALSVQGVAQIQVVTPGSMSENDAVAAARELLGGMGDVLSALRVGEGATGDG